ncbi:MAG: hypothetical protein AAGC60_01110 [Acidobacteriota bacterium]
MPLTDQATPPHATDLPPGLSTDTEREHVEEVKQAFARLVVCIVALLYMAGWSILAQGIPRRAVVLVVGYAVLSVAWIWLVRSRPGHIPGT